MEKVQSIFFDYVRNLESKKGTGYFWKADDQVNAHDIARKMFISIHKGGRSDWLKQNAALKETCLKHGIRKSLELRPFIQGLSIESLNLIINIEETRP